MLTRDEIVTRLREGADLLELSLEKWNAVIKMVLDGPVSELRELDITGRTCAMCHAYCGDDLSCSECPVRAVDWCREQGSTFQKFQKALFEGQESGEFDRQRLVDLARDIFAVLCSLL